MRQKIFIFMFLLFGICRAESVFLYNNPLMPEWTFQVVYKEKYIEKSKYYIKYNFLEPYEYIDRSYAETLRALEHNIILRLGLPDNYVFNAGFDFVFQKAMAFDYNQLQTINFLVEKKVNFINIVAGIKVPLFLNMQKTPYLIDRSGELNLLLGMSLGLNIGPVQLHFLFFDEENLNRIDYFGTRNIILTGGFDFISNESQKAGIYIENELRLDVFKGLLSYVYYLIPQLKISFFDNFCFVIGLELFLMAENIFLNQYDKPQYIFKLNYNINTEIGEKEEEKQKEKIKVDKKKWWQIEGVDDEMIPETWKEMDEPRSR